MLAKREVRPNAYDLLAVDPNAPSELIATSYWAMVAALQQRREQGEYVDDALHELTRAYECVSDPVRRTGYDMAIGHGQEPLVKRKLPRIRRSLRSRLFRRFSVATAVDYYELLGISPNAPTELVPAAFRIMRDQYLRVAADNEKRSRLIRLLEEAHATISAPERRDKYDERTRRKAPAWVAAGPAGPESPTRNDPAKPGNGLESQETTSPLQTAVPASGVEAVLAPKRRPVIWKWFGSALSVLARAPVAVARLLYHASSGGASLAARAWRGRPTRRSPGSAPVPEPRPVQRPQIMREPPPRPKNLSPEVEDALLGRLEASVNETRSRSIEAQSEQSGGRDQ